MDGTVDIKAYEDSLLAVHDEVMPRMKEIQDLSTELRKIKAGLKENEMGKIESPEGLDATLESLKLADQGMWDWMKSYSDTKKTLKEDQLMPFFLLCYRPSAKRPSPCRGRAGCIPGSRQDLPGEVDPRSVRYY